VSPSTQARAHLDKAEQFLESAQADLAALRHDAATSAAVTSGINAADAVCLVLTGEAHRTQDHSDAIKRLKNAGGSATPLVRTLTRLLTYKNQSQSQTSPMSPAKARNAVCWAERLVVAAREIVTSA
jgi:uncharacterized protein (UPF0332 family)